MMPSQMETFEVPAAVEATRWLAAGSLLALIATTLLWELWAAPTRVPVLAAGLKALPLCLPLAGLLKRRMYTYRWTSLGVWLYVMDGAVRVRDGGATTVMAAIELALCFTLFAACAMHVRLRLKSKRA
jgi:uncharacterized membrane protein